MKKKTFSNSFRLNYLVCSKTEKKKNSKNMVWYYIFVNLVSALMEDQILTSASAFNLFPIPCFGSSR